MGTKIRYQSPFVSEIEVRRRATIGCRYGQRSLYGTFRYDEGDLGWGAADNLHLLFIRHDELQGLIEIISFEHRRIPILHIFAHHAA